MIYEINKNVVYVKGEIRGAIYNLEDGNVYSINEDGCKILEKYISNSQQTDSDYLEDLKSRNLICETFIPRKYKFKKIEKKINFVWLELTESCNLK